MAANKFATFLHKNRTPKIAIILIYTLLEWTLIALLLLNGLFSYLISIFSNFFGLQPPCLFCSRVDHLFGPRKPISDLVCDAHAAEISKLGFCANHRNLAEASDMCEDCGPLDMADRTVDVVGWMRRSEGGEKDLRCSCCGVGLESGFYSPYLVFKPSSCGGLEYEHNKGGLRELREEGFGSLNVEVEVGEVFDDVDRVKGEENCDACVKDESLVGVEERLVPLELIDLSILRESEKLSFGVNENEKEKECGEDEHRDYDGYKLVVMDDRAVDVEAVSEEENLALLSSMEVDKSQIVPVVDVVEEEEKAALLSTAEVNRSQTLLVVDVVEEEEKMAVQSTREVNMSETLPIVDVVEEEEKKTLLSTTEISLWQTLPGVGAAEREYSSSEHQCEVYESVIAISSEGTDAHVEEVPESENYSEFQACEEDGKLVDAEANCEISIGSEICDHEQIDLPQFNEQCLASDNVMVDKEQVTEAEPEKENIEMDLKWLSLSPKFNEVEEEKLPGTPNSIDSLHAFPKRFMIERRESGTESLDGSVASEFDGSEVLSVDNLKAALKAERKVLSALYAELEEERSASAIAANQTMAMITRLQEEKAAMQMEAFQYQRMMDEQSEYDQEALQLLNELMMKREKEKQELEKELEVYREKVRMFEAKERKVSVGRSKISGNRNGSGTSYASSSASDSDDLSFDSHVGEREEFNYRHGESNQNTPPDQEATKHNLTLDDSLDDFEEERLSILDQLKALEEKLFSADDFDDHVSNDNEHGLNGFEHDLDTNRRIHHKQRSVTSGRKRLLPLFDATVDMESEDGSPQSVSKSAINDHGKLAIVEEVDNVYERLQALEADREFLKHCVRSLKKGDKGMDLLQEILQHLRDLRRVELRVRNATDGHSSLSA